MQLKYEPASFKERKGRDVSMHIGWVDGGRECALKKTGWERKIAWGCCEGRSAALLLTGYIFCGTGAADATADAGRSSRGANFAFSNLLNACVLHVWRLLVKLDHWSWRVEIFCSRSSKDLQVKKVWWRRKTYQACRGRNLAAHGARVFLTQCWEGEEAHAYQERKDAGFHDGKSWPDEKNICSSNFEYYWYRRRGVVEE